MYYTFTLSKLLQDEQNIRKFRVCEEDSEWRWWSVT